ncbi:putative ATPase [Caldithrix abyssi DSM 13497]|uniref:Putative ATPase n=1 Tax=Caldithrix abyssi DSM 13497 TaxID=880073 RepID=H1XP36_CALAY|nr:ATP-binding protein [Caldithrix abyssi]APF20448.1 hypothetical protein Cabys_3702 [Caldithrix abyssi DSM 13497]EHO41028.1 putative ATPase [Caldithrix abyssi DSM 13497]
MVKRPFWLNKIYRAWQKRSFVWLSGVRRVGKTTLSKMIDDALYLNCDLPSTQRLLEDPEFFFKNQSSAQKIIFDEIHRLSDPSQLLKIAADEFPHLKILATGSSTLEATKKFRDSLTGRKISIHLKPVLWSECTRDFKINNLDYRLLRGGLPEWLIDASLSAEFFSEWIDSFYARDIQELFGVRQRLGFLTFFKLLLRQSGGLADFTQLAKLCGLSRPTVMAHLEILQIAHAIYLLKPFHGGGRKELTQRPKIYGFDTGFVAFMKGWDTIRPDDRGYLWEHLVLDTLSSVFIEPVLYWRDKAGHEIDFVIKFRDDSVNTYECKINPDEFKPNNLKIFRRIYPKGENFLISPVVSKPFRRKMDNLIINFVSPDYFTEENIIS